MDCSQIKKDTYKSIIDSSKLDDHIYIENIPNSTNFEIVHVINHPIYTSYVVFDSLTNTILTLGKTPDGNSEVYLYKINSVDKKRDSLFFSYGLDGTNIDGYTKLKYNSYNDWSVTGDRNDKKYKFIYNKEKK